MSLSSVSRTFWPGTGSCWAIVLRAWPAGSRTIVSLPGLPESCLSYSNSIPARPVFSVPAKPRTWAAVALSGYIRFSSV